MFALVRRADMAEVIGSALAAKAARARVIAERLGRPVETGRGWPRRFASRAEEIRRYFTVVLVGAGVDLASGSGPQRVHGRGWCGGRSRGGGHASGEVSPWLVACVVSGGILLVPSWPVETINTSRL
ncbi:hypothetical protein OJ963_40625 [Streptomyces sp. RS2]|uniref:hypothetical protein n=1 Tax=Streptomyces sp. RS2 TaxID=1451205 RepID=UPI0021F84292|nr:hypothetical protein [Streptomyces sp. RS2]MCW1100096.1 hypothetical protein [Streptomyces sp. RS2]